MRQRDSVALLRIAAILVVVATWCALYVIHAQCVAERGERACFVAD